MLFNLEIANNLMEKYRLDGLLFIDPASLGYFGYNLFFNSAREWMLKPGGSNNSGVINFCLVPFKKKPVYIIDAFSVSGLNTKVEDIGEIVVYRPFINTGKSNNLIKNSFKNPLDYKLNQIFKNGIFKTQMEALDHVLDKYNLKNSRIAIEKDGISEVLINEINKEFNNCKFFNGSEFIRLIRMIKTAEEINVIEKCFDITEKAFDQSIKTIKPDSILYNLKNTFKNIIEKENAIYLQYFIFPNGLGMTDLDSYIIEKDKIMGFDSSIIFNGFISDTGLTLFNGKYDKKNLEIYNKLLDIIESGIEKVKPGMNCSQIYKAMENKKNHHNLSNAAFEGHGVGRSFREYPVINGNLSYSYNNGFENIGADFTIEKDMVVNFEIGLPYFNEKTFQIEKTVMVTSNGYRNLVFQDRTQPIFL